MNLFAESVVFKDLVDPRMLTPSGVIMAWMWWRIKRLEHRADEKHNETQKKVDKIYSYVSNGVDGNGLSSKFVTRREYDQHRQSDHKTNQGG